MDLIQNKKSILIIKELNNIRLHKRYKNMLITKNKWSY